jgi:hypothetical protein
MDFWPPYASREPYGVQTIVQNPCGQYMYVVRLESCNVAGIHWSHVNHDFFLTFQNYAPVRPDTRSKWRVTIGAKYLQLKFYLDIKSALISVSFIENSLSTVTRELAATLLPLLPLTVV